MLTDDCLIESNFALASLVTIEVIAREQSEVELELMSLAWTPESQLDFSWTVN